MNKGLMKLILSLFAVILITAGSALFINSSDPAGKDSSAADTPAPTPVPETEGNENYTKVSLFLCGDAILHESVYEDARNNNGTFDFSRQLDAIAAVAEPYDLQYYNQESVLGGTALGLSGYPSFNSPWEFGEYMVAKGFNLVSTANDHALDCGVTGIQNSKEFWNAQKYVAEEGTNLSWNEYKALPVHKVKGLTYVFLSYCEDTSGLNPPDEMGYLVNYSAGHEQEMLEKVKKASEAADIVIVAMHWGTEYSASVTTRQMDLAQRLADAGADIIIGNNPHVVQPAEWLNEGRTICFYSMGNLISSQLDQENRIGLVAGLDIIKEKVNGETTVRIENVRMDLTYTSMEGTYPDLYTNIKVQMMKDLDDTVLPGQEQIYEQYKEQAQSFDSGILFGGV